MTEKAEPLTFIFDGSSMYNPDSCDTSFTSPGEGRGGRAFLCNQYLKCLDIAADRDWIGFNCDTCTYEDKGPISFYFADFLNIDQIDAKIEAEESEFSDLFKHDPKLQAAFSKAIRHLSRN